ncbi:hypothetical protein CE163_01060, partial [Bifidobacterium breve]
MASHSGGCRCARPFALGVQRQSACFVSSVELHGNMPENIADKANNDTHIVKQFTNPVKEPIDSDINLFDLLDERARRDPDGAMIEYKTEDGTWQPYSAQVFRDMVIDLAKGLIGLGVNKGDSVAIVSRTRWEWTALDMAIMSIGALTVPVYETNSA